MKKTIITVAVLGGLALAGTAPYWFGQKMESHMRDELARVKSDPNTPPWLNITMDKYERGWFSSTATLTATIDLSEFAPPSAAQSQPELKPLVLNFENEIKHGPFVNGGLALGVVESRWVPSGEMADIVAHYFPDQAPFSQTIVIGMSGHNKTEFHVPAFSGHDHLNLADIHWQGLKGAAQADMQSQKWQFEMDAPLFERVADNQSVAVKSLAIKGQGAMSPAGVMLGDTSLSLGEIAIAAPDDTNVMIKGIDVAVSVDEESALLRARESLGFERVAVANQFEVGPGEVVFELHNLDEAVMADLQRQGQQLQSSGIPPEEMAAKVLEMFKTSGTTLLKASPEFEISKLSLATEQGDINGKVFVSFDGTSDFDINMPPSLIAGLKVDAQVSVPTVLLKKMFESQARRQVAIMEKRGKSLGSATDVDRYVHQMVDNQIAQFEAMNFIVADGQLHRAHLKFMGGELLLNDKPANHLLGGAS